MVLLGRVSIATRKYPIPTCDGRHLEARASSHHLERLPYYDVFECIAFSVDSITDRQLVELRAHEVAGVFAVDNGLVVARD